MTLLGVVRRALSFLDACWRRLAPCGAFGGKYAIGRQLVLRKRQAATVDDNERRSAPDSDTACSGKVEFC
jgi:hypothetical protein